MSGIVEGQRALVVGVANKRSIAWSIARALDAHGARVALTYQNERTERDVRSSRSTFKTMPRWMRRSLTRPARSAGSIPSCMPSLLRARKT